MRYILYGLLTERRQQGAETADTPRSRILIDLFNSLTGWRAFFSFVLILSGGVAFWYQDMGKALPFFLTAILVFTVALTLGLIAHSFLIPGPAEEETSSIDLILPSLIGILALNTLLMVLAFLTPLSSGLNFAIVALPLPLAFANRKLRTHFLQLRASPYALLTLVLAILAARFWSYENFSGLYPLNDNFVASRPWQDIFFHTGILSIFSRSNGAHFLNNIEMAGTSLPLYHYASYLIPAFFETLTGTAAYGLATRLLPALGMVCTGMAAYSFGTSLAPSGSSWRDRAGLLAAVSILLIPDGSFYAIGNRWTSYFFFQQVGMAGTYGVSALAVAWIFAFRSMPIRALAFCLVAAIFKVQIPTVYSAPLLIFLALDPGRQTNKARTLKITLCRLAVVSSAYVGLIWLSRFFENAPTLAFSTEGIMPNLMGIAKSQSPEFTSWLQKTLSEDSSYLLKLLWGAPIVLLWTYGPWLALTGALFFFLRRIRPPGLPRGFLFFPILMLLSHLIVALALAKNESFGDAFEIYHKTFVWPYFALLVWNATGTAFILGNRPKGALLGALLSLALLLPYFCGPTVQSGLLWSAPAMNLSFPKGLYHVLEYVRDHSGKNTVIQLDQNDSFLIGTAISERSFYVLRGEVNQAPMPAEIRQRFTKVSELLEASDFEQLRLKARTLGLDWLLTTRENPYPWQRDPSAQPTLCSGQFCAYSFGGVR